MNRAYWDAVAADYDGQVLSVFDHDTEGLIKTRIEAIATPGDRAADLGCGVGKFTPLLARCFDQVAACDLSERAMAETRARCDAHDNVAFWALDLAVDPLPFSPVDFVLCVNVLIMPSLDVRMRAWRAVTNQVARGGTLLVVVPSLESMHYEHFRALETCLHDGCSCLDAIRRTVPRKGSIADLHQGIHPLDGQRTKHYLREELEWMLQDQGFDPLEVVKLEYPWHMVYLETPPETSAPLPWDWVVVARRQ